MQIRRFLKTSKPESDFDRSIEEELSNYILDISKLLNKGLDPSDNFNCQIKSYTTNAVADTQDAVSHALKRVPSGFWILNRDKAGIVYDGGSAWTATNIYLKCNVASVTVKILIY